MFLFFSAKASEEHGVRKPAERVFQDYLSKHAYDGATVGVLQNENLLFASAQGTVHDVQAKPGTLVPILGVSKLITAVAALQLVEDEYLSLDDKVFGPGSILHWITPRPNVEVDRRIYDITVKDLLRHTAGFDETKGPIYDPVLNQVYVARGSKVVDIAEEMNLKNSFMNEEDIMSFMMGMPLFYTPGTVIQHSNFGYSILGRVIEAVTGLIYEEYVIENILIPAGMLNTRIGPPPSHANVEYFRSYLDLGDVYVLPESDTERQTLFDLISPGTLDSTLGWYSNIYDLSRLFTVLFSRADSRVLRPETVRILLSRALPVSPFEIKSDIWSAMGNVMVKNDGSFWYGNSDPSIGSTVYFHYSYYQLEESSMRRDTKVQAEPEAVIFLGLSRHKHRKHLPDVADMMLNPFLTEKLQGQNAYVRELADDHFSGRKDRGVIVRYQLSEHRVKMYSNALRLAGYYIKWIHGYTWGEHSYYTLIAETAKTTSELDYKIEISPSKEKILKFLSTYLTRRDDYYRLSFVQTFRSASHQSKPCHVVIIRKSAGPHNAEFAIESDVAAYYSLFDEGLKDGYQPLMQSVDFRKHEHHVTFLMRQDWEVKEREDVRSYHDLSLDDLETTAKANALEEYTLYYLDTYMAHGKPRFSALFRKGDISDWLMQTKVEYYQISEDVHMWRAMEYSPELLVAYSMDDKLYFAGVWRKM